MPKGTKAGLNEGSRGLPQAPLKGQSRGIAFHVVAVEWTRIGDKAAADAEMLARGLSVRDVENTLADALGAEAALSKSTVSRVCQAIGEQFEAWRTRPLDGVLLDYLFLDASRLSHFWSAVAERRSGR